MATLKAAVKRKDEMKVLHGARIPAFWIGLSRGDAPTRRVCGQGDEFSHAAKRRPTAMHSANVHT